MNLNGSNLFPVLFLFLSKADIYLLKYPFSYQVPVQYLSTTINKREVTVLANTDKSAIDSQLKSAQEKTALFPPTYAKSGGVKQGGGKGINRSYKSEKESERLKLGGECLEGFLLKCSRNAPLGSEVRGGPGKGLEGEVGWWKSDHPGTPTVNPGPIDSQLLRKQQEKKHSTSIQKKSAADFTRCSHFSEEPVSVIVVGTHTGCIFLQFGAPPKISRSFVAEQPLHSNKICCSLPFSSPSAAVSSPEQPISICISVPGCRGAFIVSTLINFPVTEVKAAPSFWFLFSQSLCPLLLLLEPPVHPWAPGADCNFSRGEGAD